MLNDFRKLSKLQLLDLSSNQLIEFPSCVKDAPMLKILRLIHNRINKIPEDFFQSETIMSNLAELNVNSNPILKLNDQIGNLSALVILGISYT